MATVTHEITDAVTSTAQAQSSEKAKIGVFVMALLEDANNKTGHLRPEATKVAHDMASSLGEYGTVVDPGLVENEAQAATAARLFNAEDVDIIVAIELAFTNGVVPVRCALDTSAPMLVWNTQMLGGLEESQDFDVAMLNSGICGLPEMTAALTRLGREFTLVTSRFDDAEGRRKVAAVIKAAAVRRRLRRARVGFFSHPYEGMTDLMFDQLSFRQAIGPVVWPVEPELVAARAGEIEQREVDRLVRSEGARFKIDMDAETFERSARAALALESVAREQRLDAMTGFDHVWLTDPRIGVIPSYGGGRLCELGIAAAPEGDVATAVAQLVMQEFAGHATTMENLVIDFDHNAVMLCHDGFGNPAMATPGEDVLVQNSTFYTGVHGRGAAFKFAYKPGPVTNFAIVTVGGNRWRFVISEGELLPFTPRPMSAPQTLFRADSMSISDWCDGWLLAAATHHWAAAHGHWARELSTLAKLMGVEAVVV
jgi:L-arabinose isomerase